MRSPISDIPIPNVDLLEASPNSRIKYDQVHWFVKFSITTHSRKTLHGWSFRVDGYEMIISQIVALSQSYVTVITMRKSNHCLITTKEVKAYAMQLQRTHMSCGHMGKHLIHNSKGYKFNMLFNT